MHELLSDPFCGELLDLTQANAQKYANAHPHPHIRFDELLATQAGEAA